MKSNQNKIKNPEDLTNWFKQGMKTKDKWRVGTEHEKFAYNYIKKEKRYMPAQYHGKLGISKFLNEISKEGWVKIEEENNVVALKKGDQSITLEPGGQIELSGAPLKDLHSTCRETGEHLSLVKKVGKKLNLTLIGLGARPFEKVDDVPWMPKARYKIMKNYMPHKGGKGLEMMKSTCTVQANLDFSSEEDMRKKIKLAVKIQPVITALFSNSPLTLSKPNGFLSRRRFIWTDTDPDRCGVLKIALDEDFSFNKYIDYALSVPMYFVVRNNQYINCSGMSFKDFIKGKMVSMPGEFPTIKDWEDHLSTIFTEVRLKKFIEVRGADAGNWNITCALPAFWVGLLYSESSLSTALDLCSNWTYKTVEKLSYDVCEKGLKSSVDNTRVSEIAKELVKLSRKGLEERGVIDSSGQDETGFLSILDEIINTGKTPAQKILDNFNSKWKQNTTNLIKDLCY